MHLLTKVCVFLRVTPLGKGLGSVADTSVGDTLDADAAAKVLLLGTRCFLVLAFERLAAGGFVHLPLFISFHQSIPPVTD